MREWPQKAPYERVAAEGPMSGGRQGQAYRKKLKNTLRQVAILSSDIEKLK